jgi:hypothetical protein
LVKALSVLACRRTVRAASISDVSYALTLK